MSCLRWNSLQHLLFPNASFLLTLCLLVSIASSRSRLRLCFSAWGRGEDFGRDAEGFGGLLEQSLAAPLPASLKLRTRPTLSIFKITLSSHEKVDSWFREAKQWNTFICNESILQQHLLCFQNTECTMSVRALQFSHFVIVNPKKSVYTTFLITLKHYDAV